MLSDVHLQPCKLRFDSLTAKDYELLEVFQLGIFHAMVKVPLALLTSWPVLQRGLAQLPGQSCQTTSQSRRKTNHMLVPSMPACTESRTYKSCRAGCLKLLAAKSKAFSDVSVAD